MGEKSMIIAELEQPTNGVNIEQQMIEDKMSKETCVAENVWATVGANVSQSYSYFLKGSTAIFIKTMKLAYMFQKFKDVMIFDWLNSSIDLFDLSKSYRIDLWYKAI